MELIFHFRVAEHFIGVHWITDNRKLLIHSACFHDAFDDVFPWNTFVLNDQIDELLGVNDFYADLIDKFPVIRRNGNILCMDLELFIQQLQIIHAIEHLQLAEVILGDVVDLELSFGHFMMCISRSGSYIFIVSAVCLVVIARYCRRATHFHINILIELRVISPVRRADVRGIEWAVRLSVRIRFIA